MLYLATCSLGDKLKCRKGYILLPFDPIFRVIFMPRFPLFCFIGHRPGEDGLLLCGETKALNSYSEAIQNTLKLGYKAGMAKGLGIGCTYGIACMSWALVFWYAGVFIRNGQTDGGKAFTAIFSAIVGGLSVLNRSLFFQ